MYLLVVCVEDGLSQIRSHILFKYVAVYVSLDSTEIARMYTMAHQLSCNPVQIFGLTTENKLAPAVVSLGH